MHECLHHTADDLTVRPVNAAPIEPVRDVAIARQRGLGREARCTLLGAAAFVVLCGLALAPLAGFGPGLAVKAALVFAVGAFFVWRGLPAAHPFARFGAANRITLFRLAVAALLAGVIGEALPQVDAVAWVIVVIAILTALLDAVDGPVARRDGLASDFGARFDMETDAWLTLVLCGLVLHFGKAGAWVLAAGLMRYAFVAAAWPWPWLAGALPPSLRRKTVCVVQITTLIVCLAPVVPAAVSSWLAAISLAALIWSFAVDVRVLARAHQKLGVNAS
jgi:phosphatidylglycerophosphate synthase